MRGHFLLHGSLKCTLVGIWAAALLVLGAACGPLPFLATGAPATVAPQITLPAANILVTETRSATMAAATATPTEAGFALNLTPLPTETALPTLELPTQVPAAAALEIWDGLPTYPAESRPDYYFRVRFDPKAWALTTDQFGSPTLAARALSSCAISPSGSRGLPLNGTVDHDVRRLNGISFQVNTAYVNGIRQFVNYVGGEGTIYTAFAVTFTDQADTCLTAAETVLGTLRAVPGYQATPIATP
jgi:hypothetical protein